MVCLEEFGSNGIPTRKGVVIPLSYWGTPRHNTRSIVPLLKISLTLHHTWDSMAANKNHLTTTILYLVLGTWNLVHLSLILFKWFEIRVQPITRSLPLLWGEGVSLMVPWALFEFLSFGRNFSDKNGLQNSRKPLKIERQLIAPSLSILWGEVRSPIIISCVLCKFLSFGRKVVWEKVFTKLKGTTFGQEAANGSIPASTVGE